MLVVGIDAGEKGGIGVLPFSPSLPFAQVQPRVMALPVEVYKEVKKGKKSSKRWQLNRRELVAILYELADNGQEQLVLIIEEPPVIRFNGRLAIASLFRNYGEIRGIAAAMKPSPALMTPRPQDWKAAILSGTARNKLAAINYVRNLYPGLDIRDASGKDHDGYADALCIAEYGVNRLRGGASLER